jgi:hypothetical protein
LSVLARFLGTWIDLQRKNGTIQALYDHWILGRDARPRQPRWLFVFCMVWVWSQRLDEEEQGSAGAAVSRARPASERGCHRHRPCLGEGEFSTYDRYD